MIQASQAKCFPIAPISQQGFRAAKMQRERSVQVREPTGAELLQPSKRIGGIHVPPPASERW